MDRVPLDIQDFNGHYSPAVEGWYGFPSFSEPEEKRDPCRAELEQRLQDKCTVQHSVPSWVNRYFITPRQRIREKIEQKTSGRVRIIREIDTPKGVLTAVVERYSESVGTIWTLKYPVESREDMDKIRSIPWELPSGLDPPDLDTLPPDPRDRRVLYTYISSPVICVAGMMEMQSFLMMCATDLPLIEELTEECLDRALQILDVLLSSPGIDVVWIGGSEWLTPPMASPDIYDRLIQQQESRLIAKAKESGALTHVHCHGNVREILPLVVQRGTDYFEPVEPPPYGDVEFAEAIEKVNGAVALGGNIELALLENGSEVEIGRAVQTAFHGNRRGMVLATSAASNLPVFTDKVARNYHCLIDQWEELSSLSC